MTQLNQMKRIKILVTDKIGNAGLSLLRQHADVQEAYGLKGDALLAAIADADGLMVRSGTQVTADVLAAAPKLNVVARAGSGVDNVDVPEATRRGVLVVNAPGGNAVSAAEMTIALLMATVRKVPNANASLKAGEWKRESFKGMEISGKVVGLVGLGAVGKVVARILNGFGARVLAYDPFITDEQADRIGVQKTELDVLLGQSDVVSVHVPLMDATRNMISGAQFSMMKRGVILLNAARGGVVDETALLDALKSGQVGAAGVDVFAQEPFAADSIAAQLVALDNVVATPHLGALTYDAQEKVAVQAAEQLIAGLLGKPVQYAVNKLENYVEPIRA
ncbi:hypothetical protein HY994_06135 [Candidatus Micrarchaeota archaeon]|nr:hypothetical protein [Candidatus Micrarchaeota archaeon]